MDLTNLCKKYKVNYFDGKEAVLAGKVKAVKNGRRYNIEEGDFAAWVGERCRKPYRFNNKQCRGCVYSYMLDHVPACDYLEKTGHRRNCPTYPTCEKRRSKRECKQ